MKAIFIPLLFTMALFISLDLSAAAQEELDDTAEVCTLHKNKAYNPKPPYYATVSFPLGVGGPPHIFSSTYVSEGRSDAFEENKNEKAYIKCTVRSFPDGIMLALLSSKDENMPFLDNILKWKEATALYDTFKERYFADDAVNPTQEGVRCAVQFQEALSKRNRLLKEEYKKKGRNYTEEEPLVWGQIFVIASTKKATPHLTLTLSSSEPQLETVGDKKSRTQMYILSSGVGTLEEGEAGQVSRCAREDGLQNAVYRHLRERIESGNYYTEYSNPTIVAIDIGQLEKSLQ